MKKREIYSIIPQKNNLSNSTVPVATNSRVPAILEKNKSDARVYSRGSNRELHDVDAPIQVRTKTIFDEFKDTYVKLENKNAESNGGDTPEKR